MDGLLLDTEGFYTTVQEKILERYGKVFDWSVKVKMMGKTTAESTRILFEEFGLSGLLTPEQFLEEHETMLEKLLPTCVAMPGVVRLIHLLHTNGVPIAVATRFQWQRGHLGSWTSGWFPCQHCSLSAAVMAEEDKLNVCDPQAEVWLKRVDELRQDTIDEDYSSLLGFSCLCQCTVHARHRASIGKRVVDALDEVNKLTEEGRQFRTFGFKPPPRAVSWLPLTETVGLEPMLTRLHDLLEKGGSSIIGVWGQGGIGKTTLLHAFNNDLEKEDHNYQVVIFIEVSNSETLNTVADC
jgi:hypothetical protein